MAATIALVLFCILLFAAALAGHTAFVQLFAGALLGGIVVALTAIRREQPGAAEQERRETAPDPALDVAFEAIDDPLLLIERGAIIRANAAARNTFGQHVVGEDFRLAIRHPAASGLVANARPGEPARMMLDAIGSDARRYELQATALGEHRRLVRLADRATAEVAERMRTDFVANASHELRTPLATLIGFIETLEDMNDEKSGATRARFLKIMAGEARRMGQLVEDLISLSRIEGERFSAPATPVPLAPLAAEVRAAITEANCLAPDRITVEADPELVVAGDRNQLAQLLHNLIGNALKYGRADAPVTVSIHAISGARAAVAVTDQGDGIPPEHLPRLTERFYRVDPGRSRAMGGTGLGLAIVKHIVERHRGRLAISSQQGVGTTVTVTVPLLRANGA